MSRNANAKINALRALMEARGIDGYIIPSGDAHASEYFAAHWRSREWVSGFTGSAGLLVVMPEDAGLWTDGRYFIQAERELVGSGIKLFKIDEPDVPKYQAFLADKLPTGGKVGFDGRVFTATSFAQLKKMLAEKNISYEYKEDLVGLIWKDRPAMPKEKAFEHAPQFAGKTSAEKLADVRAKMKEKKITAYLLTALDGIAWLLNIRGNDIKNFPVVYAFALITESEAHMFIDPQKISPEKFQGFIFHEYDDLPKFLRSIKTNKLYYNPNNTNVLLAESVSKVMYAKNALKPAEDIVPLLKAVKTPTEIANIKNAFVKEGVVMVKMLYWLESAGKLREGDVVRFLQNLRKEQPHYLCDSFDTIVAYGENAAQAHYNSGETGAALREDGFVLIDTGGQYLDGTTDTTRTVCLGAITDETRRDFTLVLKGHIALSRAVFLSGTTGTGLDILSRLPLWESGQNFRHGTGHGLGYCLGVHEGPHKISQHPNTVALTPGMLVSNEPGIYKEGRYGIRTENVLLVTENQKTSDGVFLSFETLTYCPIDLRAIAPEMLTQTERDWLNAYHKRTYENLSPYLTEPECEWLKRATKVLLTRTRMDVILHLLKEELEMFNSIIVDSGCDVSKEIIDGENCAITHIPLNLQIGDEVYLDDDNLDLDEYLKIMEAATVGVKTSAPSPSLFLEQFKKGDNVFVVTLSSKLSATYQSAISAKDMYIEEYGKKFIHVFDSFTASIGEGVIAMKIAELIKKGTSTIEIVEQVNQYIKEVRTYFILDKFDNLVKTGRMNPQVAKIASFLNVKPICGDNNGEIKMLDKARGYTKAVKKLVQMMKANTPDIGNRVIGITHVKAYKKAIALKEEIMAQITPKDIIIQECRGVTTVYANRGGVIVAV